MEDFNFQTATKLLSDSLNHLAQTKGKLNNSDIETDVMNVTCFNLLKKFDHQIKKGYDNNASNA